MSNQEAELDAAIAEQSAKIDDLKAAVDALIAAIPPGVDLSDEIAAVRAASARIGDVEAEAEAATPPPPA